MGKEDTENESAMSPLPEDDPAAEATQCTVCLAPGFMRKCCGEFYCNDCFFRNRACPGCGAPAVSKGFSYDVKDPGGCALALGWFTTHSIWLSALLIIFLVSFDEAHRRRTVSGFKCYKYMGACDRHACVTLNDSLPPVLQVSDRRYSLRARICVQFLKLSFVSSSIGSACAMLQLLRAHLKE